MPVERMPTGEFRMVQLKPRDFTEPVVAQEDRPDVRSSVGDIRLFTMVLGGLIGAGVAATSYSVGDRDKWLIFAIIAALLGIASGEAFGFGLSRWAEVKQYHTIKRWKVWFSLTTVLLLACGLIAATPFIFGDKSLAQTAPTDNLTPNGVALSALAILGGLSTAATLAAIKQVVADPLPGSPGQQLDALLRLRRISSRLLSQLGLLVLLVMAVNAAALGWGEATQDRNVVIFSGVVASFVVATMYVPTASNLRRRGSLYVDRHFALDGVAPSALITAADDRIKLEKMLGLDQTTFGELKAGLVVLTPVVVGILASLVKVF
jgi:hypothetical protein